VVPKCKECGSHLVPCGCYPIQLPEATEDQPQTLATTCRWDIDGPGRDCYATECGNLFVLVFGTPEENHMNYCCYCGGRLKE